MVILSALSLTTFTYGFFLLHPSTGTGKNQRNIYCDAPGKLPFLGNFIYSYFECRISCNTLGSAQTKHFQYDEIYHITC